MLRSSPLFQLYLVRLRDFYRQPARVFWVYGFPTIMAIALGFAFQNRPPAPIDIDLVKNRGRRRGQGRRSRPTTLHSSERGKAGKPRLNVPSIEIHEASEDEASHGSKPA